MRILYITTVGGTMPFFTTLIHTLIEEGNAVDIAANISKSDVPECYREWGCKVYPLSCTRSPFDKGNLQAIKEIRRIVKGGNYDIVHCHTPIAAMCTRLACRPLRKTGVKVFYTAHGFRFCKGSPLKNWFIFYPVEWICAFWTDMLITINEVDYALAKKHMHASRIEFVPGVGINLEKFAPKHLNETKKEAMREKLGIPKGKRVLLSVGELSREKNQQLIFEAFKRDAGLNYIYCVCGNGKLQEKYEQYITNNQLNERIKLLGFRTDISDILQIADLYVFPSIREGLPVALMEAISSKVMVICSESRGNTDLIKDERCLFDAHSVESFLRTIHMINSY